MPAFQKLRSQYARLDDILTRHNTAHPALSQKVFEVLIDRCTTENDDDFQTIIGPGGFPATVEGLVERCDALWRGLKEASVAVQRLHPAEWNAFARIVIRGLQP